VFVEGEDVNRDFWNLPAELRHPQWTGPAMGRLPVVRGY